MAVRRIAHPSIDDRKAKGLEARDQAQLSGHTKWRPAAARPERRLPFDLNDFDETLPGPFEYDVKRMAAIFMIAGRSNGFSKADAWAAALASVTAYREAMAGFAQIGTMNIWYAHLALMGELSGHMSPYHDPDVR